MERWLPVTGWEGRYEVSDVGGVRNARTRRPVAPYVSRGRARVQLFLDGRRRCVAAHVLVARAFLEPPHRPGLVVCPRDGDRLNNRADNLFYTTFAASRRRAAADGLMAEKERNGQAKLTAARVARVRALLARGRSAASLAREEGVHPETIGRVRRWETWRGVFPASGVA